MSRFLRSVFRPRKPKIDAEKEASNTGAGIEDIEMVQFEPEAEKVNSGLWTLARVGKLIECKQWRVLDGNFRFLFDGRIMYGPGCCFWWWAVIIHLIATMGVFFCFDIYPFMVWNQPVDYIVPITSVILAFISVYNIVAVVFTDPGYIPRPPPKDRMTNLINYQIEKKPNQPLLKNVFIDGKKVLCVFCENCCHFRPPRVHHCEECDCCIDRYDHYCFVFGTGVGRRNYGAFLRFLFSIDILFVLVGTISLINLNSHWRNFGFAVAVGKSPTFFVILTAFVVPPFGLFQIFWLLILHIYYSITDQTVYEKKYGLSRKKIEKKNTKSILYEGLWSMYKMMVTKPPDSLISPRSYVKVVAVPRTLKRLQERKSRSVFSCSTKADAGEPTTTSTGIRRKFNNCVNSDQFIRRFRRTRCACARPQAAFLPVNRARVHPIEL